MEIDMKLSKRLQGVADYVTPGCSVADIGCDHAHISIYLVMNHIAPRAIAMDINKGPLERAKENIEAYGCANKIEIRLSDGGLALKSNEADTILISGMGGPLTVKILKESKGVVVKAKELILQPQSDISSVRKYLHEIGFLIIKENMFQDDEKTYTVMKAISGEEHYEYEIFYKYGKILLENKNTALKKFLEYGLKKDLDIVKQLKDSRSTKHVKRLEEVTKDIQEIKVALFYYTKA
jgi:tRNA (adenine22-N1)-methyltransferase